MKILPTTVRLSLLVSFISTTIAQSLDLELLPECSRNCVAQGIPKTIVKCGVSGECLCRDEELVANSVICVTAICSKANATESFNIIKKKCAEYNINVDLPIDDPPPTSGTPLPHDPASIQRSKSLAIGLGVGLSLGAALVIIGTVICIQRRKRRGAAAATQDEVPRRISKIVELGYNPSRRIFEVDAKETAEVRGRHELDAGGIVEAPDTGVVELEGSRRDTLLGGLSWGRGVEPEGSGTGSSS